MLLARLSNGLFIFGLDAENIRRLTSGQPIMISFAELGLTDDFAIMYGETLDDIKRELESAQGSPLPEPIPLKVARKEQ